VAECATQIFITNDRPNVAGIIMAGSADFKTELSQSDLFDQRLQAAVIGVVDVSYGACCLVQAAVIGVVDVSYNACCLVGAAAGRSVCNSWVAWGVGTVCSVRAAWCALCFGAANLKGLRMLLIQVRVCSSHSKACLVTQVSFGYAGLVRSWVLSPAYLVLWHRVELSGFLTT
jgi:hypothetical protein